LLVVAVYFRKRKEPEYHNYGKLPDFHEKQLTLEEVLNDPNIPHIAWNTIERGKRIGIGGSGIVWQATMREGDSSRMVALKQLLFGLDNIQEDILQEFLREIRIMNALKHENVVEFLGVAISDQRELYLVTELMGNGSLFDLLTKKQQNMPWHLRLKLLKDAATGMAYLHQRSLIHRDLKSQNLLVSDQWVCKVSIFRWKGKGEVAQREMNTERDTQIETHK
jgi:serine/threonine protein kinase